MANDLLTTDTGRFPSAALLTSGGAGASFLGPSTSTVVTSTAPHLTATSFSTTATTLTSTTTATSLNDNNDFCKYEEEQPCEKFKQFLDASFQERTFMIEKLIEIFANVIDSIWHPKFLLDQQQKAKVVPTRGFCFEILKRSRTTYATLQISLFYVFRVKKVVHEKLYRRYQAAKNPQQMKLPPQTHLDDLMCCGRRMFLASLMVASKYLHDKNFHNKVWSKLTGLDIKEINAAEMAFLKLIDYRLHVSKPTFDKWYTQLHKHIQKEHKSAMSMNNSSSGALGSSTYPVSHPVIEGSNISSTQLVSSQQEELRRVNSNSHEQNYPSPPSDLNVNRHHANPSLSFAPPSPPMASSTTTSDNYARVDSGVSFDILSPPSSQKQQICSSKNNLEHFSRPTGIKRPSDEDTMLLSRELKRRDQRQ